MNKMNSECPYITNCEKQNEIKLDISNLTSLTTQYCESEFDACNQYKLKTAMELALERI